MPNYFNLTRKGESEPERLHSIDNRLWREIGKTDPDPDHWFYDWKNSIGFSLAMGKSFEDIIADCLDDIIETNDPERECYCLGKLTVACYLNKYYIPCAWSGR